MRACQNHLCPAIFLLLVFVSCPPTRVGQDTETHSPTLIFDLHVRLATNTEQCASTIVLPSKLFGVTDDHLSVFPNSPIHFSCYGYRLWCHSTASPKCSC
ncbi:hypothetical protein BJ170DRAFT_631726 [Xylariales sp. AK1849]|nr:hypothetical protein BJ170DRAFT_631726 [Xylariales sp. AK1849]